MSSGHFREKAFLTRRFFITVVLVLLVGGSVLVDQNLASSPATTARAVKTDGAVGPEAISSAWYCPMVRATKADGRTGSITLVNPTDAPVTGTASIFPTAGQRFDIPFNLGPKSREVMYPSDVLDASFAATLVRVNGGGLSVDHSVRDATGEATAPCLTTASPLWHFVSGNTAAASTLFLGLFNPFEEDAIADIRLTTNEGDANLPGLQGIIVPAHALIAVNVSEQVRRREWVAGSVITRRGRLTVDQLQAGTIDGVRAIGLTPAAPASSTGWYIPDGVVSDGVTDRLSVFNPTNDEAVVNVEVTLAEGHAEPFELHVAPGNRVALDFQQQSRIPKNVRYSLHVQAMNGVPVVAGRSATASAPSRITGATIQTGALTSSKKWIFAAGSSVDPYDETIWIFNASDKPTDVRVQLIAGGESIQWPASMHLEPKTRAGFHIDDQAKGIDSSVVVESDEPIVSGRELVTIPGLAGSQGGVLSSSLGVPFR